MNTQIVQDPTQSTVNTPIPQPSGTPQQPIDYNQGRDLNKESEKLKQLGVNSSNINNLDQKTLLEATYSPQELASMPYYQHVKSRDASIKGFKQGTQNGTIAQPSASVMRPLEEALKVKENIGRQSLGESDLFKKAGLDPYLSLSQSLSEHSREIDTKFNSYANLLETVGGQLTDAYSSALNSYKLSYQEYQDELGRIDKILERQAAYEEELNLINKRATVEKDFLDYRLKREEAYRNNPPAPGTREYEEYIQLKRENQKATLELIGGSGFSLGETSINDIDVSKSGENSILSYSRIYAGSPANGEGVDFTAKIGTPVKANINGQVLSVGENGGWGNQVKIKDNQGNVHTYNHLSKFDVAVGDVITAGTLIGAVGNSGNVMAGDGSPLTAEMKKQGRGAHLDYTVYKPDGKRYTLDEAYRFATGQVTQGTNSGMSSLIPIFQRLGQSDKDRAKIAEDIKSYSNSNDIKGLQNYITQLAFQDLGQEESTKALRRNQFVDLGKETVKLMDEYEKNGGNLGIFTGTKTNIQSKINKVTDPKAQEIAQIILINLENFGRNQTGAAIQDFEKKNFKEILPTIFDGKELAEIKLNAFAKAQEISNASSVKYKIGEDAYNLVFGGDNTQNASPQPSKPSLSSIYQSAYQLPSSNTVMSFEDIWEKLLN